MIHAGRADARAVRVFVDGTPVDQHQLFRDAKQPVSIIGPDATVEFRMFTYDGMPASYAIQLHWENPSGQPGAWSSELTLVH
jgi:hypothetical protein